MSAPQAWGRLLAGLQHLRLTNSDNSTAAAAVCISLASSLTSLHVAGSPGHRALTSLTSTIPYISPDQSVPDKPSPPQPVHEHGTIPVPVTALQLVAAAVLDGKESLPCYPLYSVPKSPPAQTAARVPPPLREPAPIKDHAVLLPNLRSITTDADHLIFCGSLVLFSQYPPTDLLSQLPDTIPPPQQGQHDTPVSSTLCLSSVAAAAAARALTLPTTPPSAPARLLAHPRLCHIDAPHATLLSNAALLSPLTSLSLDQVSLTGLAPHRSAAVAVPQLQSLSFSAPSNLRHGVPRSLPPPGLSPALTRLHLAPRQRSTLPFSDLARLVLDCPALVDLDVSRCITAPPSAVIAPRAAVPVHFFLHIQSDPETDGSLPAADQCSRGPPARLRRFACDDAPGCLYLLPLLDSVRPVRALEDMSASNTLCLPGRLLALLAQQPHLQRLQLLRSSRCISPPQDTAVLAVLASTTTLATLALSPSSSSGAQACAIALTAVLPALCNLRELSLPRVTAGGTALQLLTALAAATGLVSLSLPHAELYDSDVEVLAKSCSRLTQLSVAHSPAITAAAVHTLTQLSGLESLDTTGCTGLYDACGDALARITTLTALSLACTSCGAAAARELAALPRLRHVALCPHWELRTGRGKGGAVLVNRGCRTTQREDMVMELARFPRLRGVTASPCLLAKARGRLVYEGLATPLWMM